MYFFCTSLHIAFVLSRPFVPADIQFMPSRVIYLTVDIPQADVIQAIRERFDPLAGSVPPHITLVFPFDSEISSEALIALIDQAVAEFEFEYVEISFARAIIVKQFCFLPIDAGRDQLTELHDFLYSGILEPYLAEEEDYVPHLTIGRSSDAEEAEEIKEAAEEINLKPTGAIRSIILEQIHSDNSSHTEYERWLRPDAGDS